MSFKSIAGIIILELGLITGAAYYVATPNSGIILKADEIAEKPIKVKGKVYSEKYVAPSGGLFGIPSSYDIGIETKFGKKVIKVKSTEHRTKESLDTLIQIGDEIEFSIFPSKHKKIEYNLPAYKIQLVNKTK